MDVLGVLVMILNGVLISFSAYQVVLFVLSLVKKKQEKITLQNSEKINKIICLVAARNEEKVITGLIDSLHNQNYPKDSFEVMVIPNNCTDNTEAVSLSAGASVYLPKKAVKSKGDALNETIEYLMSEKDFDAVCIFDADNIVHKDYLSEMNLSLNSGNKVVTGYRDSKNPYETKMSGVCSIAFWTVNKLYNEVRENLNLSAVVTGTGFIISREVLVKLGGWNTKTLTEDNEFNVQCALNDIRIAYNKNAIFYDEQPLTFEESFKQRRRWTTGDWQVIGIYYKELFKKVCTKRSMLAFDTMVQISKSIVQVLIIITLLLNIGYIAINGSVMVGVTLIAPITQVILLLSLWFGNTIIGSTFLAFAVAFLTRADNRNIFGAVASFWVFTISYLFLTNLSLIKKETTWKAISHNSAVKPISNHA